MTKTKNKSIKTGILVIGISFILIFGVKWILQFMEVDTCLDKGEKCNYDLKKRECLYTIDTNRIADYYWRVDFDTILNREYLVRGSMIDSISKSPNELIEILNKRPSKCKIEYIETAGDTLKIRILDDKYLTEQMGTLGAECYMAETVFTLTESDLIQFVRFDMDHGSHAGPGSYSRNDYLRMIKE
jgi:hypothetical protein